LAFVKSLNDEVYLKSLIRGVCLMNLGMAGKEAAAIRGQTSTMATFEERVVMKTEKAVECNILPHKLYTTVPTNQIHSLKHDQALPSNTEEDPTDHPYT
jgi:hypothetical protein